jgi:hypothetical protein
MIAFLATFAPSRFNLLGSGLSGFGPHKEQIDGK